MVGYRVRRGFRRSGLVLAAPLLVASVGALVLAGIGWARAPGAVEYVAYPEECARPYPSLGATAEEMIRDAVLRNVKRCTEISDQNERWAANGAAIQRSYYMLAIAIGSAVVAVLWFGACWALGWVLAGFARDEPPV
jgi:hypothetical protein